MVQVMDMYKSPIDMMMSKTVHEIQTQQEEHILRGVFNVGINVDKEELIKALQYDRGQYDKGYADGVREFAEMVKSRLLLNLGEKISVVTADDIDRFAKEMVGRGVYDG